MINFDDYQVDMNSRVWIEDITRTTKIVSEPFNITLDDTLFEKKDVIRVSRWRRFLRRLGFNVPLVYQTKNMKWGW